MRVASMEWWCREPQASETPFCRHRAEAFQKFLAEIPVPVRRLVRPFTAENWEILKLLDRCGGASGPYADLLRSTPALGFYLAERRRYWKHLRRTGRVRRLLEKRQPEIAEALSLPRGCVKMLRKIPRAALTPWRMFHLVRALRDPEVGRLLSRLPRLNASVLRIATDPQLLAAIDFRVLVEISARTCDNARPTAANALASVVGLAERLENARFAPLRTLAQVEDLHEAMLGEAMDHASWARFAKARTFPPPPFDGVPGSIEPIRTPEELFEEGRQMRHCVASYAMQVAPEFFFYRYIPERATFMIRKTRGRWIVAEMRGIHNASVSAQTWREIARWLESAAWQARPVEPEEACGTLDLFPGWLAGATLAETTSAP